MFVFRKAVFTNMLFPGWKPENGLLNVFARRAWNLLTKFLEKQKNWCFSFKTASAVISVRACCICNFVRMPQYFGEAGRAKEADAALIIGSGHGPPVCLVSTNIYKRNFTWLKNNQGQRHHHHHLPLRLIASVRPSECQTRFQSTGKCQADTLALLETNMRVCHKLETTPLEWSQLKSVSFPTIGA